MRHSLRIVTVGLTVAFSLSAVPQEISPEQVRAGVARAGGLKPFLASQATHMAALSGQMINSDIQLMGASAIDSTIFQYVKMVNFERAEISTAEARDVSSRYGAAVICTSPTSKVLIGELGAEYRYMVYSKSGEYLFQYSLNSATCSRYLKR